MHYGKKKKSTNIFFTCCRVLKEGYLHKRNWGPKMKNFKDHKPLMIMPKEVTLEGEFEELLSPLIQSE